MTRKSRMKSVAAFAVLRPRTVAPVTFLLGHIDSRFPAAESWIWDHVYVANGKMEVEPQPIVSKAKDPDEAWTLAWAAVQISGPGRRPGELTFDRECRGALNMALDLADRSDEYMEVLRLMLLRDLLNACEYEPAGQVS